MITKRIKITLTAYLGLCWLAIIWLIAYFLQLKSGYVSDDDFRYERSRWLLFESSSLAID